MAEFTYDPEQQHSIMALLCCLVGSLDNGKNNISSCTKASYSEFSGGCALGITLFDNNGDRILINYIVSIDFTCKDYFVAIQDYSDSNGNYRITNYTKEQQRKIINQLKYALDNKIGESSSHKEYGPFDTISKLHASNEFSEHPINIFLTMVKDIDETNSKLATNHKTYKHTSSSLLELLTIVNYFNCNDSYIFKLKAYLEEIEHAV